MNECLFFEKLRGFSLTGFKLKQDIEYVNLRYVLRFKYFKGGPQKRHPEMQLQDRPCLGFFFDYVAAIA